MAILESTLPEETVCGFTISRHRPRPRAPQGARFLAYQQSGVREYNYAWPDASTATNRRLA